MSEQRLEECAVCGEYTGKAGAGDGSIFCNCGAGPFCNKCWDGHWCAERADAEAAEAAAQTAFRGLTGG